MLLLLQSKVTAIAQQATATRIMTCPRISIVCLASPDIPVLARKAGALGVLRAHIHLEVGPKLAALALQGNIAMLLELRAVILASTVDQVRSLLP